MQKRLCRSKFAKTWFSARTSRGGHENCPPLLCPPQKVWIFFTLPWLVPISPRAEAGNPLKTDVKSKSLAPQLSGRLVRALYSIGKTMYLGVFLVVFFAVCTHFGCRVHENDQFWSCRCKKKLCRSKLAKTWFSARTGRGGHGNCHPLRHPIIIMTS